MVHSVVPRSDKRARETGTFLVVASSVRKTKTDARGQHPRRWKGERKAVHQGQFLVEAGGLRTAAPLTNLLPRERVENAVGNPNGAQDACMVQL